MIIFLNQIGYVTGRPKIALATDGAKFSVADSETNDVVYESETVDCGLDELSGYTLKKLNFSALNKDGSYYLKVGGVRSPVFKISGKPYADVKIAMTKQLYYQRCGMALIDTYAGAYVHGVCHRKKGIIINDLGIPTGKSIDVSGGWHDAGDYGRYTIPAAVALAHLLYAFDFLPERFNEKLDIPYSYYKIPDIITECKYEFEWLFKMQAKDGVNKGGFYHKVATKEFCGMIMPEKDDADLYVFPVSSAATAAACAVMMVGMRVMKRIDSKFARRLRDSAELAWRWLSENDNLPFTNPPEMVSGEYGVESDTDGRFWAAVEMYRFTKEQKYYDYIRTLLMDINPVSFGWEKVGGFGTLSYLMSINFDANERLGKRFAEAYLKEADRLVELANKNPFGVTLGKDDFIWGSNMSVMCNAIILLTAFQVCRDQRRSIEYENTALNQLNYLLGKNATGYCFVSGFGAKSINFPHNRPSTADSIKQCIPGIVSGGPNSYLEDDCIKELLKPGTLPARCFLDDYRSFSTNENAIYWNSCAIFVAAYFN